MSENLPTEDGGATPREVIGRAIQNIMAVRLGRGFLPVGVLFVIGAVEFGRGSDFALALGAVLTGLTMLAYGLRIVQKAFGRPPRLWMSVAVAGSLVPPVFSVYVIGWRGLRGLAPSGGVLGVSLAILLTVVGVWVLRCWMKIVEVERLARAMAMNSDD